MADHSRSPTTPTTDLSTLLGIRTKSSSIFDISKGFKFLGGKWHGNNHHHHRQKGSIEAFDGGVKKDDKIRNTSEEDESTSEGSSLSSLHNETANDKFLFCRSFLSRNGSRKSHTPTPSSLSRSSSRNNDSSNGSFSVLSRNKSSRRCVSTSRQNSH